MSLALKINFEGQNRRIRIPAKEGDFTLADVNTAVAGVFKSFEGRTFSLSYLDDEGDEAQIASDIELQEALACAGDKQKNGDWQLKLKVKVNGDEPACLQSIAQFPEEKKEEKEEEVKEEKEEEKSLLNYTSPAINTVPLTELFDEHVISNPFFVQMREDFVKFAQNVRDSVPRDFPEETRQQMEAGLEGVRQPIMDFAAEMQKNHKDIRVPEGWKENPLIVQLSNSLNSNREQMSARMQRWNETNDRLVEMGFEDSPFIQRVLILIHDGDLRKVLDDLLVRQGQHERIQSTFQNIANSIVSLFHNLEARGAAFYQKSTVGFHALGGHIQAGACSSAQFIHTQIDANQENIQFLQGELDRNVRALQTTVTRLNEAGAHAGGNIQEGWNQGANAFTQLFQNVNVLLQQRAAAGPAGELSNEKEEVKEEAKEEEPKKEESKEKKDEIVMDEIPKKDEAPADPRLDESLKLLQEMGFVDVGKCTELLVASNFDMEAVLDKM